MPSTPGAATLWPCDCSARRTSAGQRWSLASGTSAATAWTSGAAAVLLARHDWPAAAVRSALVGTAAPVPGSVLRSGAGSPVLGRALRTRLVHDVPAGAYRAWLVGTRQDVNTPSLLGLARTAPYLHDGSASTLKERLVQGRQSNRHGSTSHLSDADIDDLVAYLQTL